MLGALYSAITGMDAAATSMDTIGNNIANVNTCAFKAGTTAFASIYSNSVSILGGATGNEAGLGVQVVGLNSIWQQGAMDSTSNPTDVAIQGDGFFRVDETGGGEYYTRAGQFRYDANYNLTDPDGRIVQGWAYATPGDANPVTTTVVPIQVPGATYDDFVIEQDGVITGTNVAGTRQTLFQICLFDFPNVDGLRKMTANLYQPSTTSGLTPIDTNGGLSGASGYGVIQNNHLEMSNVDLAREFVDLIVSQKAFQANSRVISSSSDMLSEVINIIR